jgi:hypothetical protein
MAEGDATPVGPPSSLAVEVQAGIFTDPERAAAARPVFAPATSMLGR